MVLLTFQCTLCLLQTYPAAVSVFKVMLRKANAQHLRIKIHVILLFNIKVPKTQDAGQSVIPVLSEIRRDQTGFHGVQPREIPHAVPWL